MITRNLEHLLTPQPSVPHRTAQERGHSTERPASVANSHQNHFSTMGNLATKISRFQSYIGIVKAIPLVRSSLGSLSYEESITVFFKEPDSSEESALSFHLSRRLTDTNATLTIMNGLTIAFVGDIDANDNIILMDSHLHLP